MEKRFASSILRNIGKVFNGYRKVVIILVVFSLMSTGCGEDFLDWVPVNAVTAENYYQNEAQVQKALTAAYSTLGNRGMYGWWLSLIRNLRGDNTNTGEAQLVQHAIFTVNDTDRYLFSRTNLDGLWPSLYVGILRCNLIIIRTPQAKITNPAVANRIIGQARFLRALFNFHLVTYWNRAPLMLEDNFDATDVALSDPAAFYAAIERDLTTVIENNMVPWVYEGTVGNERGRATMGAAYALLGKAYLFQEKYALAAAAFEQVLARGSYSLINVDDIWTVRSDNGPENVFEVQFSNVGAGPNPFFDDGVQAAETTMRNQTLAPNQYGGWENAWPTQSLLDEFEPGDLRRQAFIALPGESFPTRTEPFRGIAANKGNYAIKKGMGSGWSTGTPNGTGEENFPIIRFADVLLMYAEALIRSNINVALASELIDRVRARAFGYNNIQELRAANLGIERYAASRGITLFQALKHERRVELCFEGHRYTDLQRWGDAATNPILLDRGWSPAFQYYPLSREDVDLSSLID